MKRGVPVQWIFLAQTHAMTMGSVLALKIQEPKFAQILFASACGGTPGCTPRGSTLQPLTVQGEALNHGTRNPGLEEETSGSSNGDLLRLKTFAWNSQGICTRTHSISVQGLCEGTHDLCARIL